MNTDGSEPWASAFDAHLVLLSKDRKAIAGKNRH